MVWLHGLGLLGGCMGSNGTDSGTTTPLRSTDATWPVDWADAEQEVLRLVNIERTLGAMCGSEPMPGGADPLEMDELLRDVARAHSQDMAKRDFFDHVNPNGKDPFERMDAAGFSGDEPWAENIAAGSPTASSVVDGWMNSPGHCVNIMDASFGVIGIGLYYDAESPMGYYWTQNFAASH